MSIKALSELKKKKVERQKKYSKYLVYGSDLFAYETYWRLRNKHGKEHVTFFYPHTSQLKSIDELLPIGPSTLRGVDNIEAFKKHFPEIELLVSNNPAVFVKEGELRPFGGRSKSEKLLFDEAYYSQAKAEIKESDLPKIFSVLESEQIRENPHAETVCELPLRLYAQEAQDLVEPECWQLQAASEIDYSCEKLYWCASYQHFLDIFENKEKLSDRALEMMEQATLPDSLYYQAQLKGLEAPLKEHFEQKQTLFIPLSYTHEWGHFIGDIIQKNGQYFAEFFSYVEKNASSEEDISKKFRLFKKNLQKIYPPFEGQMEGERLLLKETLGCQKIDDDLLVELGKNSLQLSIAGAHAPLESFKQEKGQGEYSKRKVSHFVRAALSVKNLV